MAKDMVHVGIDAALTLSANTTFLPMMAGVPCTHHVIKKNSMGNWVDIQKER